MSLSLGGVTIPNDGYVLASGIGEGGASLHCNTDRMDCCRQSDHWYLPNGTLVGSYSQLDNPGKPKNFFYRNRYPGVVHLNRIGNPPERGRFHCEIANAASDMVTMYVNIGELFDHRKNIDYYL